MSTAARFAYLFAGAIIAALMLAPFSGALDDEAFRAMLRLSGRLGFTLWLATFAASPLVALTRSAAAKYLLRHRRGIGLMFAGSHAVHGALLVWYALAIESAHFLLFVLIGGGIGFVLIAAMAITSFDGPARAIGTRAWRRLHTFGTWYISGIFAVDFVLTPILKGRQFEPAYLPFALALVAVYAMRAMSRLRVSSPATT